MRTHNNCQIPTREHVNASIIGGSLTSCYNAILGIDFNKNELIGDSSRFIMGKCFEDYVASIFPLGIKFEREVDVKYFKSGFLPVYGRIDFLINKNIIIELKHGIRGDKKLAPKLKNVLQLYTYIKALNLSSGRLIYYIGENDRNPSVFNVRPNSFIESKWNEWMSVITEAVNSKIPPHNFDYNNYYKIGDNVRNYWE